MQLFFNKYSEQFISIYVQLIFIHLYIIFNHLHSYFQSTLYSMFTDFDFNETMDEFYLTFYVSPKETDEDGLSIKVVDEKTLDYDGKRLLFYKPAIHLETIETKRKIEVKFRKCEPGRWYSVDGKYLQRLQKQDEIERINDEIERMNREAEGEENAEERRNKDLMDMLKDLYSNGNDEIRMAMDKSFNESNGTVLSTDWKTVSSKNIKPECTDNDKVNNK